MASLTKNPNVNKWVDEMIALTKPDKVVWIDGSEEQLNQLRDEACATGEMIRLNQEKLPGCLYHRTLPNDVARVEDRTFICSRKKEDAGPTNNWCDPKEMYAKLTPMYDGVMKGRTMYIIPYSMGPIGSPLAKVGVEVTDSIYVVLNMAIMTRMGEQAFENLGDVSNDFVRGLHSKANVDPENRYIVQFPEDNTIWSINSAYGGNVLLGKKCFALRIASYQGKNEGWMAEHMLILGIEKPNGEIKYVTAAFPSACGKTNLAMLIPPQIYTKKGYKVWTVGDDIAWLKPGEDGRLYAINPENGFFGVAPGTNEKSNPNALASTRKNTIFTNVAINNDDMTVWWEKLDDHPPVNATEWKGTKVNGPEYIAQGNKLAHPNSRFTAPAVNCPCISPEFNNPKGVPISAIIFGGRRAKTAPLVYQSFNWQHGTFVGSIMASETTAAATGAVGVVRRDPMAMLPFCGYNMGDYWAHWLEMGKILGDKAPKIFNVNWFRTDDDGNFIWPGFGDNMREVAVTEGDKVEVQAKLGWQVNTWPVGKLVETMNEVTDAEIDALMDEYRASYEIATDNIESIRYQAREEIAMKKMFDAEGCKAFSNTFQDLYGMRQLPGLASQHLMAQGYGYGGEGDWKVAAMTSILKAMSEGQTGGTAFMEDYTYHLEKGNEYSLGAHMLEVCPSVAAEKPRIEVHPLGIGDREDPARLVFEGHEGKAIVVSLVDMGGRLRLICQDIECVKPIMPMPNLPVARVMWKAMPNLTTGVECWITAGGAHHTVLSYDVTAEQMKDWATMMDIEFVHITKDTTVESLEHDLFLADLAWKLK